MEDARELSVQTGLTGERWIRAVDLLPGTPSIVRSAEIAVTGASNPAFGPERVLARWLPGQDPEPVDRNGAAYRLPAGATLTIRVHYRKTWQFEGKALTDRSTVGIYFAPQAATHELLALTVTQPSNATAANQQLSFSQAINQDVQALAVAAIDPPPNITLQAQAILPDGQRAPLIKLLTRADWTRRYWFEKPISLPRGTKIEVLATLDDPDLMSAAYGKASVPKPPAAGTVVRLSLDVVAPPGKAGAP
jgi:hypothetical protein